MRVFGSESHRLRKALPSHESYHTTLGCVTIALVKPSPPVLVSVQATFRFVKRLMGHASYITALDWSLDGRLLQSTDGGYELLYWDVQVRDIVSNQLSGRRSAPHV